MKNTIISSLLFGLLLISGQLGAVHSTPVTQSATQFEVFSGSVTTQDHDVKPDRRKKRKKVKNSLAKKLGQWLIGTSIGTVLSFIIAIASFIIAISSEFIILIVAFYLFWFLGVILGIASLVLLILFLVERAKENE